MEPPYSTIDQPPKTFILDLARAQSSLTQFNKIYLYHYPHIPASDTTPEGVPIWILSIRHLVDREGWYRTEIFGRDLRLPRTIQVELDPHLVPQIYAMYEEHCLYRVVAIWKRAGNSNKALADAAPELWHITLQRRDGRLKTACLNLLCARAELQENILQLWCGDRLEVATPKMKAKRRLRIREKRTSGPFENIPVELVLLIAECLPIKNLQLLARTCKSMRRILMPRELLVNVASWKGWLGKADMMIVDVSLM